MKNKKKKIIITVLVLVLSLISVLAEQMISSEDSSLPNEPDGCKVHFIDVGQGDCQLIECSGKYLLIDAGENGHETEVLNYLRKLQITKLDYVIATHQHSDHIGGLAEVFDEFSVDVVIMPKLTKAQTPTNSTYTAFLKAVQASEAQVVAAKPGLSYSLGDAVFEILGPVTDDAEDINNMSAVTKLTYGENTFVFTGDAETEEEREIIENGAALDCDVLKVGHHGSYGSSSKDWLNAVTPEICVIQCGENNDYGHPHEAALKRINKHTDNIYRNDICGDIVIASDGVNLDVRYEYEVE